MKTVTAMVVAFSLLATACQTIEGRPVSAADVEAATAAWGAAYDSRDAARIMAMYAPDAVFWGTTSATVRSTPDAIFDYFKDAAKRPNARVRIVDHNVRLAGEYAVDAGSYIFTDVRDGKAVENPARFTFVFRRDGSRWVVVHHHSSRVPAP